MGVTRSSVRSYDETCLAEDSCRELGAALVNEVVAGLVIDVPDVLYDATLWRRWLVRLVTQLNPDVVDHVVPHEDARRAGERAGEDEEEKRQDPAAPEKGKH